LTVVEMAHGQALHGKGAALAIRSAR
jgi:hypothetical protein